MRMPCYLPQHSLTCLLPSMPPTTYISAPRPDTSSIHALRSPVVTRTSGHRSPISRGPSSSVACMPYQSQGAPIGIPSLNSIPMTSSYACTLLLTHARRFQRPHPRSDYPLACAVSLAHGSGGAGATLPCAAPTPTLWLQISLDTVVSSGT